jgi:hypothetical protein
MSDRLWIWIAILFVLLISVISVLSTHEYTPEELKRQEAEGTKPVDPALIEAAQKRLREEAARLDADKTADKRLREEAARLNGTEAADKEAANKEAANKEAANKEAANKTELCRLSAVCTKYGRSRQDCAVAANFENCMEIKMGHDASLILNCTDEGQIWSPPKDAPSAVECFFHGLGIN